jgi:flavin-dependent dehydrogenase
MANICRANKVQFNFGKTLSKEDADIYAVGKGRAAAFIQGATIRTDQPDQVHLLLGKTFAPSGYAYLIINGGCGTIATAYKKNTSKTDPLLESIDYFQDIGLDFTIEKRFASRGSFHMSPLWQWSRTIMVGEAGGYQDYLFGFGMRMAMYSGLAAAYKLCGEFSLAHRIHNELNLKRKISFANRVLYEQLSLASMHYWVERFHSNKAPINILRRAYDWNWRKLVQSNKIIDHYAVRFS